MSTKGWLDTELCWRHCEPILRKVMELKEPLRINYRKPEYLATKLRHAMCALRRNRWTTDLDIERLIRMNVGIVVEPNHILIGPRRKLPRTRGPSITRRRLRCTQAEAEALCLLMQSRILNGTWVFASMAPEVVESLKAKWPDLVWEPLEDGSIAIT